MMELIFTLDTIQAAAAQFGEKVTNDKIIAFHGTMGSGKTTFIHALCNEMKIEEVVSSPTYSIINEYQGITGKIYHIDLYRLKDTEEAIQAGVEDCLYSDAICLVEWPERAASIFPPETMHVYIDLIDEGTRRIRIGDN